MPSRVWSALVASTLLALAAAPSASAAPLAPKGFFGVAADGPALGTDGSLGEAAAIRASGARSVRVAAYWDVLEPADGRLELASFDRVVLDAARHGLVVLPVVHRTPGWAAREPGLEGSPPRDPETYARFLTRLVERYGPRGSLWAEHPEVKRRAIRRWQIWNEPELRTYWSDVDWSPGYVRLLKAAYRGLKAADPRSVVVTAGLTNQSWRDLRVMYFHGAMGFFDVAAIHPYTAKVDGVIELVRRFRHVMRKTGDARKPVLITEMGWSSGQGRSTYNYGWETTEAGQAARIREVLPKLAKRRRTMRIAGVYWYTWKTPALGEANSFFYTGLRRVGPGGAAVDKPALAAWRETIARLTR